MNAESQIKMFGVKVSDLDTLINHRSRHSTPATICMSMLSDVQEMIERDMKEQARQTLNCVKYILSEHVK
jgi:Mor family transcriptional regulator